MSDPPSTSRFASDAAAYVAVDAAQNLLALVVVPASLFFLAPAQMGTVTLALLGTQVVMSLAVLGLDFTIVRSYFLWPADRRDATLRSILAIVTTWSVVLTTAGLSAFFLTSASAGAVWFASVSAGTGLAVRQIPLSVFRVDSNLRWYATIMIGGSLVQTILQVMFLAWGWGVAGFLAGASLAAWASGLAGAVRLSMSTGSGSLAWLDRDTKKLAAWSLLAGVSARTLSGADRLAVYWWSPIDTLGVYGTAARWSLPLRMVSGGTKIALAPALSRNESSRDPAVSDRSVVSFVTMMTLFAAVLQLSSWCLLLTPWRPVVSDFQRLLAVLVMAQMLSCLAAIGQTFLYYVNRSAHSSLLAAVTTVLTLGGLLVAVPRYGASGAAVVQLVANGCVLAVQMALGRGTSWLSTRVLTTTAALTTVCVAAWIETPLVAAGLSTVATAALGHWAWPDISRALRRGEATP